MNKIIDLGSADTLQKEESHFEFYKLKPETVLLTNSPPLILNKEQLNGGDIEGAQKTITEWLNKIKETI